MFDHDDHHDVRAQVDRAKEAGLQIAFSNPCLELWFLLHFEDQTAHLDRDAAQSRCRRHLSPRKAVSDEDFAELESRHEEARRRAIALTDRHVGNGSWSHENPSSTMWRLVDEIRGVIS